MSVVRPQRAINAGVEVPPSSLLQTIEYWRMRWPGVAAGVSSCHATSGVSVTAFWYGPVSPRDRRCCGRRASASSRPRRTRACPARPCGSGTGPRSPSGRASTTRWRRSAREHFVPSRGQRTEVELARDRRRFHHDVIGDVPAVDEHLHHCRRRTGALPRDTGRGGRDAASTSPACAHAHRYAQRPGRRGRARHRRDRPIAAVERTRRAPPSDQREDERPAGVPPPTP